MDAHPAAMRQCRIAVVVAQAVATLEIAAEAVGLGIAAQEVVARVNVAHASHPAAV